MERLTSIMAYCDFDLDNDTIKMPKDIDIEKYPFIANQVFSSNKIINLKDYAIERIDDGFIVVPATVCMALNLEFGGDLVYILGGEK